MRPDPRGHPLFDVERYRSLRARHVEACTVARPTLVLGSTQPDGLVAAGAAVAHGVEVARRRSGGGAVLLEPGGHLWLNAWIPRGDPLWLDDVTSSALWAGTWWRAALERAGVTGCDVHGRRAQPGEFGALVCFAGRGAGEVFRGGRKVVGLSQWRSREGALFMTCAYTRWDPGILVDLLEVDATTSTAMRTALPDVAVGMKDLVPPVTDAHALSGILVSTFPGWGTADAPLPA